MAAKPDRGLYDKDGRFTLNGAYTHPPDHPLRRKVGFDDDDMKVGVSDTWNGYGDNEQHLRREDDYMSRHPIGNPGKAIFHPGGLNFYEHLTNNHEGHRTALDVRTDIRHGLNVLSQAHPNGVSGGFSFPEAESVGYAARSHFYIQRQHDAFMKTPAGQRKAANDARPPFKPFTFEDETPSAPAPTAAPSRKLPKRGDALGPNDTIRAGVTEMIKRVLPRKK